MKLESVREYAEGFPVEILTHENGREVIRAENQGGYDCVLIDLKDLLDAIKNRDVVGAQRNGNSETDMQAVPVRMLDQTK